MGAFLIPAGNRCHGCVRACKIPEVVFLWTQIWDGTRWPTRCRRDAVHWCQHFVVETDHKDKEKKGLQGRWSHSWCFRDLLFSMSQKQWRSHRSGYSLSCHCSFLCGSPLNWMGWNQLNKLVILRPTCVDLCTFNITVKLLEFKLENELIYY